MVGTQVVDVVVEVEVVTVRVTPVNESFPSGPPFLQSWSSAIHATKPEGTWLFCEHPAMALLPW